MVTLIRTFIMALLVGITGLSAQEFQGVATYKTKRNIDIKMDSTKISSDIQKKMMERMKKQFQKTYFLTFNKSESIYKEEESLDKPSVGRGDFDMIMVSSNGSNDVLYKNTKTQTYVNQTDTMGKLFLVKDSIQPIEWKLESESKYIGEYLCFKATFTKEVEVSNFNFSSGTNADNKEEEKEKEPEMETRTVTAWYTTQIPVSSGPSMYQGLPGLILEVHDGKLDMICSKIVLNPEDTIEIIEPDKGKPVNQKEHDAIVEKKSKEMMERYAPRRGGSSGETIEIRIGG